MDVEDGLWVSNLSAASREVYVAEERCGDPMCTDLVENIHMLQVEYMHPCLLPSVMGETCIYVFMCRDTHVCIYVYYVYCSIYSSI